LRSNPNQIHRWLLLLIPLAVLVLCILVVIERSPFFASWYDPVYCYLLNGLNIATGHFHVGHVDHPGTPLQLYTAALLRFFHLFSSHKDIVHDVLLRPEWYLFRIGIVSSFVIAACIYMAGILMLRFTSSIFYSLLIQLTHIVSFHALFFSQNLMSEFILVTCGILLAPLLVGYTFRSKENSNTILIYAAIISGIMVAGKFPAFSVWLLWILIMKSRKHFFLFIVISAATFVLVTFPAWHAATQFKQWVINLLTHTNRYGGGNTGFADWSQLMRNAGTILSFNWIVTSTYVLVLFIILFNAKNIFLRNSDSAMRTLVAAWFAITLHLLMVSKHFAMHYFIPAGLLIVPCIVILLKRFEQYHIIQSLNKSAIGISIALGITILLLWRSVVMYQFFPHFIHPGNELNRVAKSLNYDLALFAYKEGGPLAEPALYFGNLYSGKRNQYYTERLALLYPKFYFYYPATKTIKNNPSPVTMKNWRNDVEPASVLRDSMLILYYHAKADSLNIFDLHWKDSDFEVDSVLYSFTQRFTKESLYLVRIKKKKQE
jgi:hypothetical protein